MKRVGVIAGQGRLPLILVRTAKERGHWVSVCSVADAVPDAAGTLARAADAYHSVPVTQWGQVVDRLRRDGVEEVYLIGKVPKELMFVAPELDPRFAGLLAALPQKNDDAILQAIVDDLEREGMRVAKQTELLTPLLPDPGPITSKAPSEREWADIRFGFRMAKEIGGLDIGQTVVVKNGTVLAVEAIEGTDRAIRRGGRLGRGGAIVVKVAKPRQDARFDVPAVGISTIRSMARSGATVLAVEAGATFVVDRERVVALADAANIAVVAVSS